MVISPTSAVRLIAAPIDITQKNQIKFNSAAAQEAYFMSLVPYVYFQNYTYLKKDRAIRVQLPVDQLYAYNYVMYQNGDFSDKYFYAFIERMEYVNENCTAIFIKTDVYQTWLFDRTFKESFVMREHVPVSYDLIGSYVQDEGLSVGEDFVTKKSYAIDSGSNTALIIATNKIGTTEYWGAEYAGVFSGYMYVAFNTDSEGILAAETFLQSNSGNASSIGMMFLVPKYAVPSFSNGDIIGSCPANIQSISPSFTNSTLDGYTPKNKKMYCYPYNFMQATNNNGSTAIYKFENFSDPSSITFELSANLSPDAKVMIAPKNYKAVVTNYDEILILDGFPHCPWTTDYYKQWMTQNGLITALGAATSGLSIAAGAITGNPIAIAGGIIGVSQSIGAFTNAAIQPNQTKGGGRGSINTAVGNQQIIIRHKTVKKEYAKIIDEYFEKFGYKCNQVKIPWVETPVNYRPYWNYVQTIDANIIGHSMPDDDLRELKSIYDAGITIWTNPAYFLDYSKDNHS